MINVTLYFQTYSTRKPELKGRIIPLAVQPDDAVPAPEEITEFFNTGPASEYLVCCLLILPSNPK